MNSAMIIRLARVTLSALVFFCAMTGLSRAGTATSITGLYYTGQSTTTVKTGRNSSYTYDNYWTVTNSSTGYAYVITGSNLPSSWASSSSAKWISASSSATPGTTTAYAYSLSFNIAGSGSTGESVSNASISLTLAVDDVATIYVNGVAALTTTGSSQWSSTATYTLNSSNSSFVIGTNTITIVVSNSGTGASGLMVTSISGVVPETGTWLPGVVALGVFGWLRLRRKKHALAAAV